MPTAQITHDITLENSSGTTNKTGFMLARSKRKRNWGVKDFDVVPQRVLTEGAMRYSEFPPAIEMNIVQHTWRGGIGGVLESARAAGQQVLQDVHILADGFKVDTSDNGQIRLAQELRATTNDLAPTATRASGFAVVDTELWAFQGRDVYSWNFTTAQWIQGTVPSASNVIYRNGWPFGSSTFVPCWNQTGHTPNRYIHKTDAAASWTRVGAGTGTQVRGVKFFAKARNVANAEIMWGAHIERADATVGTHILVSTTDPTTLSTWSSEVAIGLADSPITNLITGDNNQLLIFKTNGIYTYDTAGTVINRTPEYEAVPNVDNFKVAINWNGRILATTAPEGLVELVLSTDAVTYSRRDISLRHYFPRLTELQNPIIALAGTLDFLYILVHDATNSKYYLLKAELAEFEGTTDYRFHRVASITYTSTTTTTAAFEAAMFIDALTGASEIHHRILLGVVNEGEATPPYYYPISSLDTNFGYTNDTDAYCATLKIDFGMPLIEKRLEAINVESENLSTTSKFLFDYRLDNTAAWTEWASIEESPFFDRAFPAGLSAKVLEIRVRPRLTTVGTTGPELLSLRIRGQLRPEPAQMIPVSVYLADHQRLLNGAFGSSGKTERNQLRTWDAQAAALKLYSPNETGSRSVVMVPGTLSEQQVHRIFGRTPEYLISFVLIDVGTSESTGTWNESIWDEFLYS